MKQESVYIGIDVHTRTCTLAVLGKDGGLLLRTTVPTDLERLRRCLKSVAGKRHVAIENGTQAAWLYHGLREECETMIVANMCGTRNYRKTKSDPMDAMELADLLRRDSLKSVYIHTREDHQALKQAARCYEQLNQDVVRAKNRVKAVFQSLGMNCPGDGVYGQKEREKWLGRLPKQGHRKRARLLLKELDELLPLKKEAQKEMVKEARKRKREFAIVRSVSGIGPVSGARLMGHIGTPARFENKRCLWKVSGLAVVTHSSADFWVDPDTGEAVERRRVSPRGLNRDFNRTFKSIFKDAVQHAIRSGVFKEHYERRIEQGKRPSMVRLTIARKISAAVLTCWKKGEMFDPEKTKPSGS